MLPIKSKYKIAKRLGGGIFEQTQTQKFALSEVRAKRPSRGRRGASDYNRQLLEKQRLRFTYGLKERELSNYAKKAYMTEDPAGTLHAMLEMRADSAVYRAGLASTRRAARHIASKKATYSLSAKAVSKALFLGILPKEKTSYVLLRDGFQLIRHL